MPSADIIPPRSGTAEPEKIDPPLLAMPLATDEPSDELYQIGKYVDDARLGDLAHVLERALEHVLDVVLQPERRAPHDRLVRRLEPGQTGLVDDLLHRARLLHRLVQRPPVGRQHGPDHRPGHRHGRHAPREKDDHHAAGDGRHADERPAPRSAR